jgi:hypothetical protein
VAENLWLWLRFSTTINSTQMHLIIVNSDNKLCLLLSDPTLIEPFTHTYDYVVPPLAVNLIKGHTSIDK